MTEAVAYFARAKAIHATGGGGVTNGNSHDHSGGDGGTIAYGSLSGTPTLGTAAAENTTAFEAAGAIATHAAIPDAHGPLTLENRTSDPGPPATGQMWLRTDV